MAASTTRSPTKPYRPAAFLLVIVIALAGCGRGDSYTAGKDDSQAKETHPDDRSKATGEKDEHGKDAGDVIKLTADEQKTAGLKVAELQEEELAEQLVVTATIQANQDRLAKISPRVPGRLVRINANLGDNVKAGTPLAVLDSIEIGEARSAYGQAQSEAALAQANYERAERLQNEQIISQKDYLRAKADYEKARAALRGSGDKLQMLGVSPSGASAASTFAVSAPFPGVVIAKKAVLGDLAQPDTALFTVADLTTLWIEANIYEKDLARIRPGDDASIAVRAYPSEHFRGKLTYLSGTVDKDTRTVTGRIEVRNQDGRLRPGMFATASINTASTAKALALPDEAVTLIGGQPTVFVEEHGGFEPRVVDLGERLRGRVVIKSGVAANERVAVSGTYALKARMQKSQIGEGHAH